MQKIFKTIRNSHKIQLYLLLLLAIFLFTLNIGSYPYTDGDATFYGQVARNMVEHGDWLTIHFDHFQTNKYVDKPPGTMWVMAGMFKLLGFTEFAGRSWHSLLAVFLVLLTYLIGKRLYNHQTGLISGIILTTSLQFFYQAREPLQDVPLVLCITLALYLFLLFIQTHKYRFYYLLCTTLGISIMVKGPIGLILPAAVIFVTLLSTKDYKSFQIKEYLTHLPLGLFLMLSIALPWHIYEYIKEGPAFYDFYFGSRTMSRYLGSSNFPGYAIPAYLTYILLGFLPWSPFIISAYHSLFKKNPPSPTTNLGGEGKGTIDKNPRPSALIRVIRVLWGGGEEYSTKFLIAWSIIPFLFFALSPGQIFMRYILPIYPAITIIIGQYIFQHIEARSKLSGYILIVIGSILALVTLALTIFPSQLLNPKTMTQDLVYLQILSPFLLIFALGIIVSGYKTLKTTLLKSIKITTLITTIAYTVFILGLTLNIHKVLPHKQIANYINQDLPSNYQYIKHAPKDGYTMLSFYMKPHLKRTRNLKQLQELLNNNTKTIIIVENEDLIPSELSLKLKTIISLHKWRLYKWQSE